MLASNTHPATVVAKAFNQNREYVVGEDEDILERILLFSTRGSATSVLTTTSTASPRSTSAETTTVFDNATTPKIVTLTTQHFTTTEFTSTTTDLLSTTKKTSSTKGSTLSTVTTKPNTTPSVTTVPNKSSTKENLTTKTPTTYSAWSTTTLPPLTTVTSSTTTSEHRESSTSEVPTTTGTTAGTKQSGSTTRNLPPTTVVSSTSSQSTMLTVKPTLSTTRLFSSTHMSSPSTEPTIITSTLSTSTTKDPSSVKTTMSTSEPTTTTVNKRAELHCLFAADLLNYGDIVSAYEAERNFIVKVGKTLFDRVPTFSAGIWVYGYTSSPSIVNITDETMHSSFVEFSRAVNKTVELGDIEEPSIDNLRVIAVLNDSVDKHRRANCLVFLSAVWDTSVWKDCDNCKLNVTKNADFQNVVAVSLRKVDLSSIVIPPGGKSVAVSKDLNDEDVLKVVNTTLKDFGEN
ncbi:hypothetical protein Y032_0809g2456 [Ancylostoma ceylanicum]|nr:hypothetical protein Y032_0809g2456 [Ancylostoma ceylanicum]